MSKLKLPIDIGFASAAANPISSGKRRAKSQYIERIVQNGKENPLPL